MSDWMPSAAAKFDGGPCEESFTEFGVLYENHGTVSRSTWNSDAGQVARDYRRAAAYSAENPNSSRVSLARREVTYTSTAWEHTTLEELDHDDEIARSQAAAPSTPGIEQGESK